MVPKTTESQSDQAWPELPAPNEWQKSLEVIHLWTQIIGKIKLKYMPPRNHCCQVALYVSSRGLTTSLIPHPSGGFEIEFNFADHKLELQKINGKRISFDLEPMSVADFYHKTFAGLKQLSIETEIYTKPVELPDPIVPFPKDTKPAPYDADTIQRFGLALTNIQRVFATFQSGFLGKASPIHFFWGAFDLAVTRFSSRPAPKHPGGVPNCPDWVMEESYSHELSSAGFWPGTGLGEAAFYSYAYPEPKGYRTADIQPQEAWYSEDLGEYLLTYETVQKAPKPDEVLLQFLQSTYEDAATKGNWDKKALEKGPEIQ
ncbi:MAG: DUF5996 family protein [Balneolales bacterium]